MKIVINSIHLYFDDVGAGLRANVRVMRNILAVMLLHGRLGADPLRRWQGCAISFEGELAASIR